MIRLVLILILALPAFGHRLDEYLQASLISIDRRQIRVELELTPGVAVLPFVLSAIDTDGDGALSATERSAYAAKVLKDLSLSVDKEPLGTRILSATYPTIDEMKQGLGAIRLTIAADIPEAPFRSARQLQYVNRHQRPIAVYLANSLVPADPSIRITAQTRDENQTTYAVDYTQPSPWFSATAWAGAAMLLVAGRVTFLFTRGRRTSGETSSPGTSL